MVSAKSLLNRFHKEERGAVAATYALAIIPLIAMAGVGMDYARLMGMDSELQNGADQAALAAATQLDGKTGACSRAATAAVSLVSNLSLLGSGNSAVTVPSETACDATGQVRFYRDKAKTQAANSDATARYVEVDVNAKTVDYALLPVTGLLSGATLDATAFAGLGSAICRVPPLMMCSPDPTRPFDAAAKRGMGVQMTGQGGNSWAPGDFGFLEVGQGQLSDLVDALALDIGALKCSPIDGGTDPETGNAQVLFSAINTRFDIGDGNGGQLSVCNSGACPPARNVVKDVVKQTAATNPNSCRLNNNAWELPPVGRRFRPGAGTGTEPRTASFDEDGIIDAMGLSRDLCHYNSYGVNCSSQNGSLSNRFGSKRWAIAEYFAKNHGTGIPATLPGGVNATRYQVYRWEIDNNVIPHDIAAGSGRQYGRPICLPGTSTIDRRVLTIAVVKNCDAIRGGSTAVEVDEWVDMFLVEPIVDDSTEVANGRIRDGVYMEVIREAAVGGGAGNPTPQAIRKDVPYLIE